MGDTVLCCVLLPDRNISKSTQRFQAGHSGRFCYLSTSRGPQAEAREKKEAKRKEAGKIQTPERRCWDFKVSFSKEETKRNKATVQLRKLRNKEQKNNKRCDMTVRKDLETERVCESTQLSGNPRVHTVFQSKSIDLAGLWQIIPAALHMTQSAWWIAFWWAIGLLVYQPNHPLMTASTCSLHFSKCMAKGNLQISPYAGTCCLKSTFRPMLHFIFVTPPQWVKTRA